MFDIKDDIQFRYNSVHLLIFTIHIHRIPLFHKFIKAQIRLIIIFKNKAFCGIQIIL